MLSGWLSANRHHFEVKDGRVTWLENPIKVLADTYHFLNMDFTVSEPALHQVWDHDNVILNDARDFYDTLEQKSGVSGWPAMQELLAGDEPPRGMKSKWAAVKAAHQGFQAGLELLAMLPYLADLVDFYALQVNPDLSISIPEVLGDAALQEQMAKVLAPPPMAKSDEIVAESGGMFYPREAPGMDVFINEGDHFNQGDPLYIVEVMKMFNKVYAPFAGRIDKVLLQGDGVIIKKGQALFKITPDEDVIIESPEEYASRRQQATSDFLTHNL
jgi:biotin carboxyl carrier protein